MTLESLTEITSKLGFPIVAYLTLFYSVGKILSEFKKFVYTVRAENNEFLRDYQALNLKTVEYIDKNSDIMVEGQKGHKEAIAVIVKAIEQNTTHVHNVKKDVEILRKDVKETKKDVKTIKQDIEVLKKNDI